MELLLFIIAGVYSVWLLAIGALAGYMVADKDKGTVKERVRQLRRSKKTAQDSEPLKAYSAPELARQNEQPVRNAIAPIVGQPASTPVPPVNPDAGVSFEDGKDPWGHLR